MVVELLRLTIVDLSSSEGPDGRSGVLSLSCENVAVAIVSLFNFGGVKYFHPMVASHTLVPD